MRGKRKINIVHFATNVLALPLFTPKSLVSHWYPWCTNRLRIISLPKAELENPISNGLTLEDSKMI